MTREEQIDWLCRLRAGLNNGIIFTPWNKEFTEALTGILEQQPCEDAISRQAVLDMMQMRMGAKELYRAVYDLPSVQPEQKTGRWIAYEVRLPDRTILNYRCSVCGRKLIGYNTETLSEAPFCHCGAKMKESEDNE